VNYSEITLLGRERGKYYAIAAIGLAVIGWAFYGSLIAAAALVLLAIPGEKYYKKTLVRKRKARLNSQFKDLLISLSASFQAGRQMRESLAEAEVNLKLIYGDDEPIMLELRDILRRMGSGGESEKDVLYDFSIRSENEDIMSFFDIYFACLSTGGNMSKVISSSVNVLQDKMYIAKEIETMVAQKKYESKLLVLLPVAIVMLLKLMSPGYLAPLYGNFVGVVIMSVSILTLAVSVLWSDKITQIEV
jgi:tight adherence protein B